MARMPHADRDPLAATRRLLIDGTNLLHAISKAAGSGPDAAPPAALIGRLRGAIPAATTIELVFDGPPERGLRNERIATGLVVRYSGGRTADEVILTMIDDVRMLDGAEGSAVLLVVTDDRDLRHGSTAARGADGGLGVAARSPRGGSVALAVGRQPAAGARRPAGPDAGHDQRRRPGRDRPSVLEARARRDDQEGQPAQGAQEWGSERRSDGRDW